MMACSAYFRRAKYYSADKFVCKIIPYKAFYYGIANTKSFRLIGIAVVDQEQGNGLGAEMVADLIRLCCEKGLEKITLRTHKEGKAVGFWKRLGAQISGIKDDDFEMIITL